MNLFKGRTAVMAAAAVLALLGASTSQVNAQGFGGGQRPAVGSISAIDKAGKTITVTDEGTGDSTTVSVSATTSIITQTTITVGSLHVGDKVRVQGVPTGITADAIIEGDIPRLGGGRGGPGGPGGGPGGPGGGPGGPGGGPGGPGGARPGGQPANASVQGTVKSLSPLTVSVGNGVSIVVSGSAKAKVSKISKITFSDLKIGDKVFAPGQPGDDGVVAATMIGVNLQMGGGGRFGGGGGFGGGGFGGGGRRGGRRGGGGGGQGGDGNMAPGDAPPPGGGDDGQAPPPPPQ